MSTVINGHQVEGYARWWRCTRCGASLLTLMQFWTEECSGGNQTTPDPITPERVTLTEGVEIKNSKPCFICGSKDGPAIFANEEWCSDLCRKFYQAEISEPEFVSLSHKEFNEETGRFDLKVIPL